MKKFRRDKLKLACILLALTLLASGAALYSMRRTYAPPRTEAVREAMRSVRDDLVFSGLGGVKAAPENILTGAAGWLGGGSGNLILLDEGGRVIASLNDSLLEGAAALNLLTPRYAFGRSGPWLWAECGPALILNDQGNIRMRLRFLPDVTVAEADWPALGRGDPGYAAFFPELNEALYRAYAGYLEDGFVYDDWEGEGYEWAEDPSVIGGEGESLPAASPAPQPSSAVNLEPWMDIPTVRKALRQGVTQEEVELVKRYCAWESEQLERAGDWCAQLASDEAGEVYALAVYENNAETNAAYGHAMSLWSLFANLLPAWLMGLVLLIVLTAFWVLLDARKRGFRPALWGILVLLGNVVALIVYLIVRPAEARCPMCGAIVQRDYVACPMCGASLKRRCPACGRAQEGAWVCCPYCGAMRPAAPAGSPGLQKEG